MKKKNRALVIGGSGFLGSNLADYLTSKDFEVGILDKKKSKWINNKQKFYNFDIGEVSNLKKILKNYDYVYHFGDIADLNYLNNKPEISVTENILKTVNLFRLCSEIKIKKVLYSSSVYVSSLEGGFYKASKLSAETYLREFNKNYNLNYTILRFGSLYGPRADNNNSIYKILKKALLEKKLYFDGYKFTEREFIHVHDAVQCCVDALDKNFDKLTLMVTGYQSITMEKLLLVVGEIMKIKKKPNFGNKKNKAHYEITPYSFIDEESIKTYSPKLRTEIGQGIIDLLKFIKINEE
jgi:UDP-glucose 4-epimerase